MAIALKARWRRWFERKKQRAAQLTAEPVDLERTADRAAARAETKLRRVGKLRQAWEDLQLLVRLVRAYARGEYRDVSRGTMLLVVGALAYFISPIDAILDHNPLSGFLDDAAVLAWVLSEVRAEIEAFRLWEAARPGRALPPVEAPGPVAS
jgi:uncharacterized membrane protein YkvA (DUF1232 family)